MSYAITDIIEWAKISQPLARFGELKKKGEIGGSQEFDLDIQLYNARKDLEYSYEQSPNSNETFQIGQYVVSLMGEYLFAAMAATGGSGSTGTITSITPTPLEFVVSSNSFIPTGANSKNIPQFKGYNILFIRGNITQSTVNTGNGETYYSWDRLTANFNLYGTPNGDANEGELFQLYPII